MLYAFVESLRYTGHLVPVAFLRIYLGWMYFQYGWSHYSSDFLYQPRLAARISEMLPHASAPLWYADFLEQFAIPYWQFFAYSITILELFIAISFLLGYLARPAALVASALTLSSLWLAPMDQQPMFRLLLVVHLTLAWLGAGRCLGFDYFFYKRRRGLWW